MLEVGELGNLKSKFVAGIDIAYKETVHAGSMITPTCFLI